MKEKFDILFDKWRYLLSAAVFSVCSIKLIVWMAIDKDNTWWVDFIFILFAMAAFYFIKKYFKS